MAHQPGVLNVSQGHGINLKHPNNREAQKHLVNKEGKAMKRVLKCRACDYQDTSDKFPIKSIRTMMGHTKLYHCPKCNSASIKEARQ